MERCDKEFKEIEEYRKLLIGKTVLTVDFSYADEGLILTFSDDTVLDFRFSGCEGEFIITRPEEKTKAQGR